MSIWHWVIPAFLLFPLSTSAQQTANSTSSPATEQTPASATQASPASPHGQLDPKPPNVVAQPPTASASALRALPPSAPMDQVVDRALEREHALMEMLK